MRPPSTMSYRSEHPSRTTTRRTRPPSSAAMNMNSREPLYDDHLDNSMNPWATFQDHSHRYDAKEDDSSNDSIDEEYRQNQLYATQPRHMTTTGPTSTTSVARSPSSAASFYHYHQQQTNQQQQHDLSLQSPLLEGSVTSVTTAGAPSEPRPNNLHSNMGNRLLTDQQYTSVVALGPATKRALETLQAEIIALNQRIDGLRQELIASPSQQGSDDTKKEDGHTDKEAWNAWSWVLKVRKSG